MSAFGPFQKEVRIPFEEFGKSGLFLVTGDTGAGKTTIFDAISFALFGNASGENRTTDCFRSDFADGNDKTYVELTFSHKGKTYKVNRNPMYQRNKLSGTGTTEEKANATLELPDGRIISGNTKVTEAMIELLGIDWKQYKQIAMIAQGEFLQLLTAGSNERGNIFRKVFGTQIYEEMQKKLKQMANSLKYECEELDRSMIQFLSGIVCDVDSVHYGAIEEWKDKKDINQVEKIMELLESMIATDNQSYESEKCNNQLLNLKVKEKTAEYTEAQRINKLFTDVKSKMEEQIILLQLGDEIKEKEFTLQSAKKALYTVKPFDDNYCRIHSEGMKLNEDIKRQLDELKRLESDFSKYSDVRKEKELSKPRINELTGLISRQEADLAKYDAALSLEEELKKVLAMKEVWEKKQIQFQDQKETLCQEQIKRQEQLEQYQNVDVELLDCQNQHKQLESIIAKSHEIIKEYQNLENEINVLDMLQKEFAKFDELYNNEKSIYGDMEAQFLREQAGIIAASLQEGEPCPVCGSETHPRKAVLTKEAPSEQQLKAEKLKLEEYHKKWTDASSKCSNQITKVELKKAQLLKTMEEQVIVNDSLPMESLYEEVKIKLDADKQLLTTLQNKEKLLQQYIIDKNLCLKRLAAIADEAIRLEEQINHTKEEATNSSNQISSFQGKLSAIKENLNFKTKKEAEDSLEMLRKECAKLSGELELAEKNVRQCESSLGKSKAVFEDNQIKLTQKEVEEKAAYQLLLEKLCTCEFAEFEDYRKALKSEKEIEAITEEITEYYKRKESVDQLIKQLQMELKDKQEKDLTVTLSEQIALEEQKSQSDETLQKIYGRLEINKGIDRETSLKYKAQEKTRQEYVTVSDLSRTANGELSKKAKIAFEQYVQAFYFNSVINEANKRLYKMSNSQYTLLRKEDPTDLRCSSGLELEVMDYYTGKSRSIKSLSGGESFKAALSIALGLSDVIQSFAGGIEVDAMFIDEGFGTLDSNSLEQAIETLHALTAGDCLVGIISHVCELKERIDKKITISKSIDGSRVLLVR
jgi:exonuclease SbcC